MPSRDDHVFGAEAPPVGAVEKRMKASRRIRYVLEYVALRLAFAFLGLIPVPLAVCIARWMADTSITYNIITIIRMY